MDRGLHPPDRVRTAQSKTGGRGLGSVFSLIVHVPCPPPSFSPPPKSSRLPSPHLFPSPPSLRSNRPPNFLLPGKKRVQEARKVRPLVLEVATSPRLAFHLQQFFSLLWSCLALALRLGSLEFRANRTCMCSCVLRPTAPNPPPGLTGDLRRDGGKRNESGEAASVPSFQEVDINSSLGAD